MNEFNNNENEDVMDIPVVPVVEENLNPEPTIVESTTTTEPTLVESTTTTEPTVVEPVMTTIEPTTVEPVIPTTEPAVVETSNIIQEQPINMNEVVNSEVQTLATDSQAIEDLNFNNESPVMVNQISPNPLLADEEDNVIPETMDLNYGVIPPNNSETVLKHDSNKKHSKIIVGVIIGLLMIILLVVGFLAYKFYFAVDPIKMITTKIREFGKDADEMYKNSPEMLLYRNNDKINSNISYNFDMDMAGEKYNLNLGYVMTLLKNDNKLTANITSNLNDVDMFDIDATIFKNALFIKVLENGHNFRVNADTTKIFTDIIDTYNNMDDLTMFENYADYLANAIEKNISKQDFKISTSKTEVNGKNVLANKYSLPLTKEMVNNVFNDLLNSIKNDETIGSMLDTLLTNTYIDDDIANLNINFYVTLNGIVKVEMVSNSKDAKSITFTKIDEGHTVLKVNDGTKELVVLDINNSESKTNIELIINVDEEIKMTGNLEMTENGAIKGSLDVSEMKITLEGQISNTEEAKKITNETTMNLTISMPETLSSDIVVAIKANAIVEANDSLTVPMPSGAVNIETEEGQSLFESEFSQTGLFSLLGQFLASDDLMNSAGENADEFNSYDDYPYLNNTI
ncbi:MAG: hypothetical protein IJO33_02170 [Bacilli bacterium]|nr:hypothetical protein [Bacilli bacterium]MBQ9833979.1 hypothetical protein [Bacilli bacterium]